jgi:hypothetical protein
VACQTAGVCLDHVKLCGVTSPKGCIPEREAQVIITLTIHDWGQQPDLSLLLVGCEDVKEDVALCTSRIYWMNNELA